MIFGVINQKDGVGKTAISMKLFAQFALTGSCVLLIDFVLQGRVLEWAAVSKTLLLFPVVGMPTAIVLRKIDLVERGYDHIIIDGLPRVTESTWSVIMTSNIVPVQPSPYNIWGADEVIKLINEVRTYKEIKNSVFVIKRKITNTEIIRDLNEALSIFQISILTASITHSVFLQNQRFRDSRFMKSKKQDQVLMNS